VRCDAIWRAEILNGNAVQAGNTVDLIERYFVWQELMPVDSEMRKAVITQKESKVESAWLVRIFGAMPPEAIQQRHIYAYLRLRSV